jgi:hypothetical protein
MTFPIYMELMEKVVHEANPPAPYDQSEYHLYTKLNLTRSKRWMRKAELIPALESAVIAIDTPQKWIVLTEPWCGDAAHSVPFIAKLSELNPLIQLQIELRDTEPNRIEQYLTGGSKSIPKWIIQDNQGLDLWVWGPRPANIQELYLGWKKENLTLDEIKEKIQQVYNQDAGRSIQQEYLEYLTK